MNLSYALFFKVTFPIDTTKTRLQIQGQCIDQSLQQIKYRGMTHCAFCMLRDEGPSALYSGYSPIAYLSCKITQKKHLNSICFSSSLAPALIRQASYGTIKIGMYHHLKRAVSGGSEGTVLPSIVQHYCRIS